MKVKRLSGLFGKAYDQPTEKEDNPLSHGHSQWTNLFAAERRQFMTNAMLILAKLDGDALGKAYSAFEKLARDRKEVYQQYFDALKPSFGEADNIKWIVNMKNNDEDIYKVVKLFYDANVAGFDSSDKNALIKDISDATEKASKFLEYYYGRIQRMKSDSIEDFAVFKKDVYFTFSKLDKKAKEVLANKFPQISKFVDNK